MFGYTLYLRNFGEMRRLARSIQFQDCESASKILMHLLKIRFFIL